MEPLTGRRHQLRIHCHSLGHTILGDYTYSDRSDTKPKRMYLHAYKINLPNTLEGVIWSVCFFTKLSTLLFVFSLKKVFFVNFKITKSKQEGKILKFKVKTITLQSRSHDQTIITGKSLSEALIFASTNPQYDNRFFISFTSSI